MPASLARQMSAGNSRTFYGPADKPADETDSGAAFADDSDVSQPPGADEHLLRTAWTQWHLDSRLIQHGDTQSWIAAQLKVKHFETVEGFFRIHNHIKEPSKLLPDSGYSVFRRGLWPGWEDKNCRGLLRYSCQMPSSQMGRDSTPLLVDQIWFHMLLQMIGEDTFGDATDFICGAMVTNKRHGSYRFEYWLNISKDNKFVQQIEPKMKKLICDVHQAEPETARKRPIGMNDIKVEFNTPPRY